MTSGDGSTQEALLGAGEWTYRMTHHWAKLPDGWTMGADIAGVAVDDSGRGRAGAGGVPGARRAAAG